MSTVEASTAPPVEAQAPSAFDEVIEQLRDQPTTSFSQEEIDQEQSESYFGRAGHLASSSSADPFQTPLPTSSSMPSTLSSRSSAEVSHGRSQSSRKPAPVDSFQPSPPASETGGMTPFSGGLTRLLENLKPGMNLGYPANSSHSHQTPSTPAAGIYQASFHASAHNVPLRYRKPFAQRVVDPEQELHKPWLEDKQRKSSDRKAYWIFLVGIVLGLMGAAALMYRAYASVPQDKYCLVLDEQFEGNTINKDIWFHEMQTGGFGNNEFEWTTDSTNNSFVEDGKLYIVPTLTSDALGEAAITDGYTLNLTQAGTCTSTNTSDAYCAVRSNITTGVVLPPIQSARLMTNFSRSIKYGRVEVKARMPTGDWIWPAVWMMPKNSVYGQWPRSGEIDIFESKGNLPTSRGSDGTNKMTSTLHFGPSQLFDGYGFAHSIRNLWRNWYNQGSHTFGLEWTEDKLYTWEQSPVWKVLEVDYGKGFWQRGRFPYQMANGTIVEDPWAGVQGAHANAAPFDQEFYLILNVAVGGTNGYFKDGQGDNKPWSNDASNARSQFWTGKNQWLPTWPTDPKQRGMEIEYVKMWQKC